MADAVGAVGVVGKVRAIATRVAASYGLDIFDVDDVVPGQYTLEVSSPGLDRPLTRAEDYERFTGRRAKLVMREKVDGQGYFKGTLGGVEDGPVKVVLIEGEDRRTHRVPLDVITRANLEVDF